MIECLRRAREDLAAGNFASVITIVTKAFEAQQSSSLNRIQRERLLLSRSDAYASLHQHAKALEDAKAAILLSDHQSPQAHFIAGRQHLMLFEINESVEMFEIAETLMDTPQESTHSPEENLACQGVDPRVNKVDDEAVPIAKEPVVVTYEWSGELQAWRKFAEEAKAMRAMMTSHVVPLALVRSGVAMLSRKLAEGGSQGFVLCIKNETKSDLSFGFEYLSGCSYLNEFRLPTKIAPGEAALAAVQSTSWTSGATVAAVYSAIDGSGFLFHSESPLVGSFKSGARVSTLGQLTQLMNKSPSKLLANTAKLATGSGQHARYAVVCSKPDAVHMFTAGEVYSSPVSDVELLGALEFLHPVDLKKASAVNTHWRTLVSSFPPSFFYGTVRRAFPDYAMESDFKMNPYIVRDDSPVMWRLRFETSSFAGDEFGFYDCHDSKLLSCVTDLSSRSLDTAWSYHSRKCPLLFTEETRVPLYKSMFVKVPGGRQVAHAVVQKSTFTLLTEKGTIIFVARKKQKQQQTASYHIFDGDEKQCGTLLSCFNSGQPTKNSIVAELTLQTGADALLLSVFCFYIRYKWEL